MKKRWLFVPIVFGLLVGLYHSAPNLTPIQMVPVQVQVIEQSEGGPPVALKDAPKSHPKRSSRRLAGRDSSENPGPQESQKSEGIAGQSPSGQLSEVAATVATVKNPAPTQILSETGPSIGSVRVLGHRGCDMNTQGWFLSVGNPEQYDFTVSEDGETVVVEPNTSHLTGNFEFIHCADPGQFMGKRVRFSARVKAQAATQTAQLRLRGENYRREKILYDDVKVTGTHDWKDYALEAEVGPEVTLFSYGLTFRSSGKLWISHPTLSVIP